MKSIVLAVTFMTFCAAFAEGEGAAERNKWRISVGGAFNGAIRTSVSTRNLPIPASAYPGSTLPGQTKAHEDALAGNYDEGFIHDDAQTVPAARLSQNWKISQDARTVADDGVTSVFTLNNRYEGIDPNATTFGHVGHNSADDDNQFGISAEIARELWAHEAESEDDHEYGVDFAAAFSYFFGRDVFRASGAQTRTDTVNSGSYVTTVQDEAATWDYDHEGRALADGEWYGEGTRAERMSRIGGAPALDLNKVGVPTLQPNPSRLYSSSAPYSASGDYQELEMLFMLRPWYEIANWWRVFAEAGVGVSWGRFDSSFHGAGISHDEDFSQWDCYGVAGLGTAFSYDDWTLSVDFIGRFLRDDLDVNGKYVSGSIDRSDWGFRVMLGYEF